MKDTLFTDKNHKKVWIAQFHQNLLLNQLFDSPDFELSTCRVNQTLLTQLARNVAITK